MAQNGEAEADTTNWTKVYVGNLPPDCKENEIEELFGAYGVIKRADIVKNFSFVIFQDKSSAETAIENLNDSQFKGTHIQVQLAKSKMRIDGKTENQCYECGEEGHWARECPKRKARRRPPPRRRPDGPPQRDGGRGYYDRQPARPQPPSYERDYYRGGYEDSYDRPPQRGHDSYDQAAPSRQVEYPYGRRSPPRSDPYAAHSRDPYAAPSRDPYAAPSRDPYAAPSRDPYAAPSRDPYAAPSRDPYAAPAREPYATSARDPYAQTDPSDPYPRDSYQQPRDPYADRDSYAAPARDQYSSRDSYAPSSQTSDTYGRSSDPYAGSYRASAPRTDHYASPYGTAQAKRFGDSPAPPPSSRGGGGGY